MKFGLSNSSSQSPNRLIPCIDLDDETTRRVGILYLEEIMDNEDIVFDYIKKVKGLFKNITFNALPIPFITDIPIGVRKLTEELVGLEAIVILGISRKNTKGLNNFIYQYNSQNDTIIVNSLCEIMYGDFLEKQSVRLNHLLNLKISKNL